VNFLLSMLRLGVARVVVVEKHRREGVGLIAREERRVDRGEEKVDGGGRKDEDEGAPSRRGPSETRRDDEDADADARVRRRRKDMLRVERGRWRELRREVKRGQAQVQSLPTPSTTLSRLSLARTSCMLRASTIRRWSASSCSQLGEAATPSGRGSTVDCGELALSPLPSLAFSRIVCPSLWFRSRLR
jgi:hypothetical protein